MKVYTQSVSIDICTIVMQGYSTCLTVSTMRVLWLSCLCSILLSKVIANDQSSIAAQFDHDQFTYDADPEAIHDIASTCRFVSADQNVQLWASTENDCTEDQIIAINNEAEQNVYDEGYKRYAYNVLTSDRLGPRRDIKDTRHSLCNSIEYNGVNKKCSILIVYHNEALSVLIRMVNSILDRTNPNLVHEIILLDDWSDPQLIIQPKLEKYSELAKWPALKIVLRRTDKREGLIRSKIFASKIASGEVLVFLDSHCEVNFGWLEPLLAQIAENPKRVAVPVVDWIDAKNFEYSAATVGKGGFNWLLRFQWLYFPWEYYQDEQNHIKPIPSPAMSGGLLAISKDWFHESGEYDPGMDIWGAENIEMSIRIWLCGGDVFIVPCSRVGHVFRYFRPYSNPNKTATDTKNAVRAAKVWLGTYQETMFEKHPHLRSIEPGDLTERWALKTQLNCKDFDWYIKNVYPDLLNDTPRN